MGNETEIERILEELLHHQKFTLAREYAILLDQPRDKVSLQQVTLPIQRVFFMKMAESVQETKFVIL